MSGVEIAGLVLGAFPVILNCLSSYREGFAPLEEWWDFHRHFITFVDAIKHQMMKYHVNMTRLLDPIVTDNESLVMLIQDASDPRWKDGSLVKSLEQRLASEYGRFFRIIHRMEAVVLSLKKLLQIKDDHIQWIDSRDRRPWEWHLMRIRISFSKGKNKKVKRLEAYNQELEDILGYSERVIPIAEARKYGCPVAYYEKFRKHACGLHSALGLQWECISESCRHHEAHLLLQAERNYFSAELSLVLILHLDEEGSGPKYLWREVSVKPSRTNAAETYPTPSTQISNVQQARDFTTLEERFNDEQNSQKGPGISRLFSKASEDSQATSALVNKNTTPKIERRVRFECPTPTTTSQHTDTEEPSTYATDRKDRSCPKKDLCSPLRNYDFDIGEITDEFDNHFKLSGPGIHQVLNAPATARLVPLPELLDAFHEATIDIPRQSRFEMAAHIASALFQIQMSPWVSTTWSKRDFSFLADSENIYSCYPFVSHSICKKPKKPLEPETGTRNTIPSTTSEDNIRTSLFAVGVIILELIFGHSIEACSFRRQYYGADNRPNDQTDISTARKWSQKVLGECGTDIDDVVRRCLNCAFGPRPSFREKRFKEAVYQGVVAPLLNSLSPWQPATSWQP